MEKVNKVSMKEAQELNHMYRLGYEDAKNKKGYGHSLEEEAKQFKVNEEVYEQLELL